MTTPGVSAASAAPQRASKGHLVFLGISFASGVAAAGYPPLSVFSVLALVIALASTSRLQHPRKVSLVVGLSVAMGLSVLGLTRFVLGDALQGIIEARGRESSTRSVSLLREILFAQDAMRRYAFIDPDEDGVGSAGRLGELSGVQAARDGRPLRTPPLAPRYAPQTGTRSGPALSRDGVLYLVCLPKLGGGWTSLPKDPVDEERAERHWVGYAWPAAENAVQRNAYFIDEHERILESKNLESSGSLRLVGPGKAPACDDALQQASAWSPWRDKKPRSTLVGEAPKAQ